MMRVHQPVFPTLDTGMVTRIIEENQNNATSNNVHSGQSQSSHNNRLVSLGQRLLGDTGLLVTKSARRLGIHVVGNQTMLVHQQFHLIVRLMNAALQDDSDTPSVQNLQLWEAAFYRTEDSEASHGHGPRRAPSWPPFFGPGARRWAEQWPGK